MVSPRFSSLIRNANPGVWAGVSAYAMWGTLPLYWYLLRDVTAMLILCHRIVWSCAFLIPLVLLLRRTDEVRAAVGNLRTVSLLFCSSVLLACNWGVYIWAVNNGRVVEASLGYSICPLITMCMGMLIFRDRPSRLCLLSMGIAFAGVMAEILLSGIVPWVALILAASFAAYGLLRKVQPVESLPGLTVETVFITPFALGYIFWIQHASGPAAWGVDWYETLLLMGAGVVTAMPLILLAYGARHLPLTTLGILQYIYPLLAAFLGVFFFHETLSTGRMVSLCVIWAALALYTADTLKTRAGKKNAKAGRSTP